MSYRRGTSRTAIVEVDVDFDLEDFDEGDLIDYLEDKGYTVMEGKNQIKFETFEALDKSIWKLYQTFLLDKGDNNDMDRELRKFFAEYYNKVTV
jgi:hypothetical protein